MARVISPSRLALNLILKLFRRLARHPWIGKKLMLLEGEKRWRSFFPPRNTQGVGGHIRQVSLRITDVCNLRCHTCGQWGDKGFLRHQSLQDLKSREVPLSRYQAVLADLVANGHRPLLYLWGGEPMLYEGTLELLETAASLGLPGAVATNGTWVAAAAPRLVQAPLFLLQISIDGHTADLHNQLRPAVGQVDNFSQIQEALKAVREERQSRGQDLPLIASLTVVSRANCRYLVDLYEAFRKEVDLCVFYLSWWIDPERARQHEEDFQQRFGFTPTTHWGWVGDWRPDDFALLDAQMRALGARSQRWPAPPVVFIPRINGAHQLRRYYTDHRARFGFNRCLAIYQAAEINSNGDLSPCRDYHDYVVGNIKHYTITQLWNSPAFMQFRRNLATEGLMPVCTRCCGLMGY